MKEHTLNSGTLLSKSMMILAIAVTLILIPSVFMAGRIFENFLRSAGVNISPNFNDGYPIAEFDDPPDDLLLPLPPDAAYQNARKTLDIRTFSVKKVKFNALSGIGIDARMNLCFEFDGEQPNPFDFKNKFSFPVMHVYIKTPDSNMVRSTSDKIARVDIQKEYWKYQVIIDGMHEQARVFDNTGKFLFEGIGLYVNYEKKQKTIMRTRITAGLPLKLIGDPAEGEWRYYVAIGLLDVKNPSMLIRTEKDSSDVFDAVGIGSTSSLKMDSSGRVKLPPLTVNYPKSLK